MPRRKRDDAWEDEKDAFIVRSTLPLGRDFGLKIVAEGVEDEQTVGLLKRLGCDQVQGRVIAGHYPPRSS